MSFVKGQSWDSVSSGLTNGVLVLFSDTVDNFLYAGGHFKKADSTILNGIAAWDGNNWNNLGSGMTDCANVCSPVFAIDRYKGNIYIGGMIAELDGIQVNGIGKWDGTSWDSLGRGVDGYTTEFLVYNGYLYVIGTFDSAGNIAANSVAKWDGTSWTDVGLFQNYGNDYNRLGALEVYKNEIYVGGIFYGSDVKPMNIARWDNTNWKSVGQGIKGGLVTVEDFEIYKGYLYVGGYFLKADGNGGDFIMKWDGSNWSEVGGGTNGEVEDLFVYNNELYAVGNFSEAGGIPADRFAKWDGKNWCGIGSSFDNTISAIAEYNNSLFVGGGFWTIDKDSISHIAKWKGGIDTCSSFSAILDHGLNNASSMFVYPNPFSVYTTIEIPEKFQAGSMRLSFALFNLVGTEVKRIENITSDKIKINRDNLPSGLYFYKFTEMDQIITTGKLSIQ
ncbi:MAG: T9SS type A sorting domain-containing protein [Bacteroidetes bacterium]|nr:T9SS type A sorting domain-containing protein [Bacteroidota bacterium]